AGRLAWRLRFSTKAVRPKQEGRSGARPEADHERDAPPMPSMVGLMRKASYAVTRQVAIRRGEFFPFYYLAEFPKSGGTWTGRMVADALGVPFPQYPIFPLGFTCVIHSHWTYHPKLRRVVYLHRDGRDVMVSFYFHVLRDARLKSSPWAKENAAWAERVLGKGYDPDDSPKNLPAFMEELFRKPLSTRMNWGDHIRSWLPAREDPTCAFVSYEELRTDCAAALKRVVERVGGKPVGDERIEQAVERFSMKKMTGRGAGQEDRDSFIRKGVVGDWQNHFTREAAEVFDRWAGDMLVELGYESSRDWVKQRTFVGEAGHVGTEGPSGAAGGSPVPTRASA
ncbi:MAG: sulfotransferase domain-containing protein, partial [Planctomycetota bacterium]|nr:sulfotransferase domain-containing protein [Planctomycetota bacterium]